MAETEDLPFRSEYAKSGRASCKSCKTKIAQGELRLAILVQSPMFDGKMANWFHPNCFFTRARPQSVADIAHFESLRWEDQEKLRQLVESTLSGAGPAKGGGRGKGSSSKKAENGGGGMSANGTIMKDFRLEYAKSGQSKCGVCEQNISKNSVRIGKKEYNSDRAKMYGPYDRWHHVQCFVDNRDDLLFFDAGQDLAGFNTLSAEDKEMIRSTLKANKGKRKVEETDKAEPEKKKPKQEDDKEKEEIKKQTKKIFYYRDLLQKNLSKAELQELFEVNDQEIPKGEERMLDRLADCMTFGALVKCKECEGGQLAFSSGKGYVCTGNMSEWTKCQFKTVKPERKPFIVPDEYRKEYAFLKMYKYKPQTRLIQNLKPTSSSSSTDKGDKSASRSTSTVKPKPLSNLAFVLEGKVDKVALKERIEQLGGRVQRAVSKNTAAVISTRENLDKKPTKAIREAKELNIQVVSEDVFQDVEQNGIVAQILEKTISEWGDDPNTRLKMEKNETREKKSMFIDSDAPKSMKLTLKGGAYVDPDSKMEKKAHVLKNQDNLYSAVLGAVDITEGKNSYYKLQLLEHDKKAKWYVFRAWGRVGTTIGGNKLDSFDDRLDALRSFESLYEDKTGNRWSDRAHFVKVPGKFYPLEMDYGQDNENIRKMELASSKSMLHKAIQSLVMLIFDVESMKKTMLEFEIDMTKMPLGKLSRKQIESAYSILTEVLTLLKDSEKSENKLLDASNRFFTLIPHDFGMKSPPVLDKEDLIKSKLDMLDNLLEIEVAYSLLTNETSSDQDKDPIDAYYEKLLCDIEVLDKSKTEFGIIQKYVQNTHAKTHSGYSLVLEEVFKLSRKGESKRFKPFKKLHNRMLLWHGSRVTNFAGIISKGLRIAPPEAPVTGYMFGKGIYFADMVSKSANYCQTSRSNNVGLLLLCDVALGNMYERFRADMITKLPAGMHSTKGVGKTEPDPKEFEELDGAKVPLGTGVKSQRLQSDKKLRSDLLYNEYIVYDAAQVNIKYLLKVRFDYK